MSPQTLLMLYWVFGFFLSYADVREQVYKDLGIDSKSENSEPFLRIQRSPSVCSVTSGGRSRSNWSSSHSIDSASTDQHVSGKLS